MINENKSSCYPETDIYKQGVCSPYKELPVIWLNQNGDRMSDKKNWVIMKYLIIIVLCFFLFACDKEDDIIIINSEESTLYFPPLNSDEWESTSLSELGWNTS